MAIAFPSFRLLYLMDDLSQFINLNITTTLPLVSMVTIPISKIVSKNTKVVPFGITGASNNIRLNKYSRDITVFNNDIIFQIVGHLLGDGSIHYSRTSVTPYFVFTQTIKRFDYIWHVYLTLSPYCGRLPLFNPGIILRKGIPYPFIQVMTRSYPALIPLYNLFYQVNNNDKKVTKVITIELLQYLNPISLAY